MSTNPLNSVIHAEYLPTVFWNQNIESYDLKGNDVHIWKISILDHFNTLFKNFRHVLNASEVRKAAKNFREQDCKRYLTGRIVLRMLMAEYLGVPAASINFRLNGLKPDIVSEKGIKYNLSYSENYILIAIAQCEVGIDIEKNSSELDISSLLSTCFSPKEIRNVKQNLQNANETFILQWTRKEAILKYTGQGIIDNLPLVPSLDGFHILNENILRISENIKLSSFKIGESYVASLVYPERIGKTLFFSWI